MLFLVGIFSCSQGRLDPTLDEVGMTEKDIKETVIRSREKDKKDKQDLEKTEAPLPRINKSIIPVPTPKIGGEKVISFYVTDQVPLRDVLIELGRIAEIDVDVDPKISGGVIINAKNRPFKEIIDRIATQGKLRYSYKNKVLYFETDKPFMKNYFVDYVDGSPLWDEVQTNIENIFTSEPSDGGSSQSNVTSNKSAGMFTVYATQRQHGAIEKYLANVNTQASAQVLIEAKVVEVKLNDEFRAGIDWSKDFINFSVNGSQSYISNSPSSTSTSSASSSSTGTIAPILQNIKIFGGDINVAVNAMSKFGVTKTIQNPRLHAMNNQKASLNFTNKLVYFKVEAQQSAQGSTTGGTASTVLGTVTSTKQEEDVGTQIEITPSINLKTGEITMNIQPKITNNTGSVIDPTTGYDSKFKYQNEVPIINTRELNTAVKVASGNVIVLGGLMTNTSDSESAGVPFLRNVPILGWLFKAMYKKLEVSETVIFIKATIINSGTRANKVDRELEEKYDVNRRNYF